jgi:hypothetical protein
VRAVQESNAAVSTVAGAFASVDQGEVNIVSLVHTASGRRFTAFEFGAGDNSYGAIFTDGTTQLTAAIHDGDLYRSQRVLAGERMRQLDAASIPPQ